MQQVKCSHEACTCSVEVGEQYCSKACKEDATQGDLSPTHTGCRCGHSSCEAR